ncbi:SNF2-related protein [Dactylosporangium sp. CA-233914]|uniref:SNF2-related protein n=1 Tax=Dactylosporangium sp. CA-233914 TaxID=3239934 RepID=UPI003D944686
MIVVHGLVLPDGTLAYWAESTDAAAPVPPPAPAHPGGPEPSAQPIPPAPAPLLTPAAPSLPDAPASRPLAASCSPDAATAAPVPPLASASPSPGAAPASLVAAACAPVTPPTAPASGARAVAPRPDGGPAPHPFAVLPPLPGTVTTADLVLPSTPTAPAASPEATAHLPGSRRPAARRRAAWTVPVVVPEPGTDPEPLLTAFPDAVAGSSIGFLSDLVTFATDLVARGRVLPTLTAQRPPSARWRPALWGPDAATFETLSRAMPGVTAAAVPGAAASPAARRVPPRTASTAAEPWSAATATRAALDTQVDLLVRARLYDRPLLSDGQARHDTAIHSWLSALTAPDARLRTSTPPSGSPALDPRAQARAIARAAAEGHGRTNEPPPAQDWSGPAPGRDESGQAPARDWLDLVPHDRDGSGPQAPSGPGDTPRPGSREPGAAAAGDLLGAAPAGDRSARSGAAGVFGPAGAVDRQAGPVAPAGSPAAVRDLVALGEGPQVARLREVLQRWADSGRPAPVRTCFRLSFVEDCDDADDLAPDPQAVRRDDRAGVVAGRAGAVDEDGGSWLVEFLLQPAEEPGLLVPAADVWSDAGSPLFKWVDYPQEVLLADLGRASRLWPDLDDALRVPRPVSLRLDTVGAYRFLTYASLLHDAGFGVLLPARWQRRQELGLTLTVRTRQPAAPVLRDTTANRAAIVDFQWGLAIGDEFLSDADLTALARAKVPLVRLRGRWVHLDGERLRAGLAFLRRGGRGEMSAGEAMRLTRLVPDGDLPLPVTGVDGSGWLADLLTGRAVERLELLDQPPGLATALRPYQRRGLSWLAFLDSIGVGALLADDMGLGKTVQVLALEAQLRGAGPRPPTLIVCPLSVLGNWRREIERFTPGLTVAVHHGAHRLTAGVVPDADLVLTTYQVATRDVDILAAIGWDRVVLDEAQHVKNAAGVTARAVRRLPARHRVALTGTPVENRLTELWSIADFLNPGLLGEASVFRARYSVPIERWSDPDAARRLRRVTRPFLLRRVKTDRAVIADLPEKSERRQWCNLTLEQATLYKAVVQELFVKLREGRAGPARKGLVLSAMTKLKQVCNHPAHLMGDGTPLPGRSGKLSRLEEILAAALAAGDRALVFTQFTKFGQLLVPHLGRQLGTGVEFLHGGTPKGARDRMVERFQSGDGPGVLLVSLKAGGTGLNLTAANHVVHVDRWWNPAAEAQATDRAFRIGQRRDVQVHTFVCIGTVEERIEHVMAGKRELAGVAVGSGEGWLTGLSTDDLLDLVSLRPEAVTDA